MATIVNYNAREIPHNGYPELIVSPPFPAPCCVSQMEQVGETEWEKGFSYHYRRCPMCGYAVRHFLPLNPMEGDFLRFLEAFRDCRSPSELAALNGVGSRPRK